MMNDRIKQLLTPNLKKWGGSSDDNFSEELVKFAESIVRECMSLASECSGKVHPDDLNEIFKEHFGVK
jgi:hypothetical protein